MPASKPEERVLIIAPIGHDATAMADLLQAHGFLAQICKTPSECAERIVEGAGALLLTEEVLEGQISDLLRTLQAQPAWSELPLIILTSGGESRVGKVLELIASAAGSVTLLERPMSAPTLWHAVEVALGSRRRQYQVRDLIEEQQRKEAVLQERAYQQQALYRLTDSLTRAASLIDIYDSAVDSIIAALRCDRASLLLTEEDGVMRFKVWRGLSENYRKAVQGHSPWKPGDANAQPICIENINDAPLEPPLRKVIEEEGIAALAFLPLVAHGKLLGKVMVYYNSPHNFGPEELQLAQSVASQVAFGIERKQAEEVLRHTKEFDEAVMSNMGEGLYTVDKQGLVTSMNPAAERLFGWTFAELRGRKMHEMTHYKHRDGTSFPAEECAGLQVLRQGRSLTDFEDVFIRKDGSFFDVVYSSSPLKAGDEILGLVVVFRDISERKQIEEALRQSEERLQKAFSIETVGIIFFKTDGRITESNDAFLRMAGYTRDDLAKGLVRWDTQTPPEFMARSLEAVEEFRASGRTTPYEKQYIRKDGSRWWALFAAARINDEEGVEFVIDISESKLAQQALLQSEERYRTLVSQVKDYAIFRTDTAGVATSWNEGVRRVLGFDEAEFIGQEIARIIFTPEDFEAGVPQRELHTAATEGTASNDRWLRRKDGTRFYASGITTALKDSSGALVGFSKVLRDDTAKKQAEQHLERTVADRTADLRATNEQLESFVYSIAHDLRAPLRSMGGYSQILVEDYASGLDESGQQMLKRIQSSSEFMDKLIVDLLAYGRTARAELELGPVRVQKAWEAALLQCAMQIEQTNGHIETSEPLPRVRAHEMTLGQCLANLLSNALKFVPQGVQPRIRFWAEDQGDCSRLWIEDNGIGIAPEHHERAFRVFERLHGSRYVGTGIGLSIVRKGIERMGGQVGLESAPGKGTHFWIELPKAE